MWKSILGAGACRKLKSYFRKKTTHEFIRFTSKRGPVHDTSRAIIVIQSLFNY